MASFLKNSILAAYDPSAHGDPRDATMGEATGIVQPGADLVRSTAHLVNVQARAVQEPIASERRGYTGSVNTAVLPSAIRAGSLMQPVLSDNLLPMLFIDGRYPVSKRTPWPGITAPVDIIRHLDGGTVNQWTSAVGTAALGASSMTVTLPTISGSTTAPFIAKLACVQIKVYNPLLVSQSTPFSKATLSVAFTAWQDDLANINDKINFASSNLITTVTAATPITATFDGPVSQDWATFYCLFGKYDSTKGQVEAAYALLRDSGATPPDKEFADASVSVTLSGLIPAVSQGVTMQVTPVCRGMAEYEQFLNTLAGFIQTNGRD